MSAARHHQPVRRRHGYGEVVRETAAEAHERKVQAIEAVLLVCLGLDLAPRARRNLAEQCLAAAEAGF